MSDTPSKQLATFASNLQFNQIPKKVIDRAQWLFLDWYGSAIAGSSSHSAKIFKKFAADMGPDHGPCQLFGSDKTTSPLFAALVNGASSHVVEQDDLHNSSILHPATVVFPPLFAVAESRADVSGKDFLTAAVVGYECGIRVGEYLGPSHYEIFHMTGTAGKIAAAMGVTRLLNLDPQQALHALGSAGTQAGGLWEFLRDAADSKQLHTAKASADGLLAAYTAKEGLTAATQILEGKQGMSKGMLGGGDELKLTNKLGKRWALMETSFKFHASCRHTHPAADAMLEICNDNDVDPTQIKHIQVHVYKAAYNVLGAVDVPESIHQSKFSMGFVLALIARHKSAGVGDFTEQALVDPVNADLRKKVSMSIDKNIDEQYPKKWCSRVDVSLISGEKMSAFVDTPKGDPGNMLTRDELEEKVRRLAAYSGIMDASKIQRVIDDVKNMSHINSFSLVFKNLAT